MDRWIGKVAVVTGVSSGIGAAIVDDLVNAGVVVVGLARRFGRLEKLSSNFEEAKGKFYPKQCDVSKEEELLDVFKWVNSELGGVDILVNNAGVGSNSKIIDANVESFRNMLNVNVLATTISIREAVKSMKNRDTHGYIINMNSIAGHYVSDAVSLSLYAASKFAVTALTETVRKELAAEGNNKIKITSISPGFVKTEFANVAGYTVNEGALAGIPFLDAKNISDVVLYVLGTRDGVNVSELTIRPIGEKL